jgi:hypothetical protein
LANAVLSTGIYGQRRGSRQLLFIAVVHGTAIVEIDEEAGFFKDIYGHDLAIEKALSKSYARLE